ncbi:MAG TPA: hypothetical protein VLQ80_25270, partial [Candidatus Saccharimonadia bacterium]|nr:hypothetical protein [Candidatus Saccharimonadia bacterium]
MKAPRWGCPWPGRSLLLGLLLWSLLPSPTSSQDFATQLQALKTAIPDSQRRIASSVRAAAEIVNQNGMAAARALMGPAMHLDSAGARVYIYTSTLTPAMHDTLRQHGVRVLRSNAQYAMVHAIVSLDTLEKVAALPFVLWIGPP